MKKLVYILAGSDDQARHYCQTNRIPIRPDRVKLIHGVNDLRGIRLEIGQVVYVGTWYERRNLDEIQAAIEIAKERAQ